MRLGYVDLSSRDRHREMCVSGGRRERLLIESVFSVRVDWILRLYIICSAGSLFAGVMGLPLREETVRSSNNNNSSSSSSALQCDQCGAQAAESQNYHQPQSVFEYGNLRPDNPGSTPLGSGGAVAKAWLLGSRLYSFNQRGGVERPAVRLEESGYAVLGYVVKATRGTSISGLLEESERRQYSPQLYERDIVEVVTEDGEPIRCYVYHRPDVNQASPIVTGDWCRRNQ